MRGKVKNHHLATQVISRSSDMSKYVKICRNMSRNDMTFCQNPHWRQDLRIVVEFYRCYRWRQGGSTKQFFGTKFDDTFCISTFPSVCQSSLCTHIIKKDATEYIALPNQDLAKKVILCENCGDKFVWIALLDCTSWRKTEPSNQVVYTHRLAPLPKFLSVTQLGPKLH